MTGATGTITTYVTAATANAPAGWRAGDLVVNGSASSLGILGNTVEPGVAVRISTATTGTPTGNIRGQKGDKGDKGETGAAGSGFNVFELRASNAAPTGTLANLKAGDYIVNVGTAAITIGNLTGQAAGAKARVTAVTGTTSFTAVADASAPIGNRLIGFALNAAGELRATYAV
jgi:hypothetical protein